MVSFLSSALATALPHPCFSPSPLLDFVFILASKKERGCWLGYSQITGGMSWCLVVSRCLVLPWDCMTSARFAMDEPRGGHIPSYTFVKQSKLKRWKCFKGEWLDFVLPSVYVIACSKLNIMILPAAWGVSLDVRTDPEVFSRDPTFVTRSVHDFNKW